MNVQVKYYSRSGNTEKLANAIAAGAGVSAKVIENGADVEADVLFLGASVYWGGIDKNMKSYIEQLDGSKVREVVVFSTSSLKERAYEDMKKRLQARGIQVATENFYCRGEFHALHKGRPNAEDLKDAEQFAKSVVAARA